ncbi:MAG: T9SS type A sorting domain-containing protein, partial [Cytophagaceae bacterium]
VYTGPGVTYQWYQTAMIPADTIPGAKSRTYTASAAGTYFVKVTDPVCGVQTSSVTITSQAATPNNGVFCGTAKGGTGLTTLSVTGPGKYKWWSASTGGTVLAKGSTYTPPALAGPGPYTYYVEDTSTFTGKIGPPQSGNGFANLAGGGVNASTKANLIFNAIQAFRIDTITVEPYNYYCPSPGAGNVNQINFVVKDSVGNVVGTSSYAAPCINQAQPAAPQKIPVGISVPKGNGYVLTLGAGSSAISLYNNTQNGGSQPSPMLYTYPTTYNVSGNPVATFVSNDAATFNLYNYPDAIPGYFDWKITKGINCQRVPVVATELCTLPLSYVSFDAIPVSGFVKLNWQSSNEVNTNYYTAERSTDGIHFISIGSVDAVGNNSGTISSYSFTDRSPVSGISYYRIREVDQDGSGYYTGVKAVISEENSLVVKPNPNQGSFTASFASGISQRISLNIVNSLGQTVYQFSDVSNSEVFEKNIDLTGLAAGVYVLQVTSGSNSWVKKVMKE